MSKHKTTIADELVRTERFFSEVDIAKAKENFIRWQEEQEQDEVHIAKKTIEKIEELFRTLCDLAETLVRSKELRESIINVVNFAGRVEKNLLGQEILRNQQEEVRIAQEGESYFEEKILKDEQES